MSDLTDDQLRLISRYYVPLQGLKMIPLGLIFFLMALPDLGIQGAPKNFDPIYACPAFIALIVCWIFMARIYEKAIGHGKPLPLMSWKPIATFGIMALMAAALMAQPMLEARIDLLAITIGGVIAAVGYYSKRWYYMGMGGVMVLAGLSALVFPSLPVTANTISLPTKVSFGLTLLVCGTIDHFMLMRLGKDPAMAPVPPSSAALIANAKLLKKK
jgi:hypothetical protein